MFHNAPTTLNPLEDKVKVYPQYHERLRSTTSRDINASNTVTVLDIPQVNAETKPNNDQTLLLNEKNLDYHPFQTQTTTDQSTDQQKCFSVNNDSQDNSLDQVSHLKYPSKQIKLQDADIFSQTTPVTDNNEGEML